MLERDEGVQAIGGKEVGEGAARRVAIEIKNE
jgi:hypothetical protein